MFQQLLLEMATHYARQFYVKREFDHSLVAFDRLYDYWSKKKSIQSAGHNIISATINSQPLNYLSDQLAHSNVYLHFYYGQSLMQRKRYERAATMMRVSIEWIDRCGADCLRQDVANQLQEIERMISIQNEIPCVKQRLSTDSLCSILLIESETVTNKHVADELPMNGGVKSRKIVPSKKSPIKENIAKPKAHNKKVVEPPTTAAAAATKQVRSKCVFLDTVAAVDEQISGRTGRKPKATSIVTAITKSDAATEDSRRKDVNMVTIVKAETKTNVVGGRREIVADRAAVVQLGQSDSMDSETIPASDPEEELKKVDSRVTRRGLRKRQ